MLDFEDEDDSVKENQKINKKVLGLIVSKKCNLNCTYCYVDEKEDRIMELDVAKRIVSNFLKEEADADFIQIDFMGGEPLTAYSLIHDVCEWIWSLEDTGHIGCFATTNGVLLTEDMKQWFLKNKEKISLSLSYDGRKAHDMNRSNSLAAIDIDFFRSAWPKQPVKTTISEQSVYFLAEDVMDLFERKIPFVASFEMGAGEWEADTLKVLSEQMHRITQYCLKHPEVDFGGCFDIDIRPAAWKFKKGYKRCGIADPFYVVDMEERKYPCQMMSSLALPQNRLEGVDAVDMFHRDDYSIRNCRNCILDNICPICYAMSYKRYGDPFQREGNICRIYQIVVKIYCGYLIRKLMAKQELCQEDKALLNLAGRILCRIGECSISNQTYLG